VNTEVREAYLSSLRASMQESRTSNLIDIMKDAVQAMQAVVVSKLQLFRSAGKVQQDLHRY
jgi:fructose/tagatose bisphosphate aldolase